MKKKVRPRETQTYQNSICDMFLQTLKEDEEDSWMREEMLSDDCNKNDSLILGMIANFKFREMYEEVEYLKTFLKNRLEDIDIDIRIEDVMLNQKRLTKFKIKNHDT